MNRRGLLLGAPAALAGCSILPQRPYIERRDWPLAAAPPARLPPRPNGRTLLLRTLAAAPGMEARGLQVLRPDGSIHTDYYEEWNVPPADAVEAALREWLLGSGLFAAILAPGSRAAAGLALEGELLELLAIPAEGISRISLALTLIDLQPARVVLQANPVATAPLASSAAPAVAASGQAALVALLARVERLLASHVS